MATDQFFHCESKCHPKYCHYEECKCLGEVNKSTALLETVAHLAKTLANIMVLCNIEDGKARATRDVTTRAFLHYDEVLLIGEGKTKKRLRMKDVFQGLGRRCSMDREEAHMSFVIIKNAFKAFYYQGSPYPPTLPDHTRFSEASAWFHAAKKTSEYFAQKNKLTCAEQRAFAAKIKCIYRDFWDRTQPCKQEDGGANCKCCFCRKNRLHFSYGEKPPCEVIPKFKLEAHKCPVCCARPKPLLVPAGRFADKCPRCRRPHRNCICQKVDFELDFVQCIWDREDFEIYHKRNIEPYKGRLPVIELASHAKGVPEPKLKPEPLLKLAVEDKRSDMTLSLVFD